MLFKKVNNIKIYEEPTIKEQKHTVDADRYSIKNLCLSIGATAGLVQAVMNPFEIVRFRSMADLKNCSFSHYSTKSLIDDVLGRNKGRGPQCNGCLNTTNPFIIAKDLVKKNGFKALGKGMGVSSLLFSAKNVCFLYAYENCKFFFLSIFEFFGLLFCCFFHFFWKKITTIFSCILTLFCS